MCCCKTFFRVTSSAKPNSLLLPFLVNVHYTGLSKVEDHAVSHRLMFRKELLTECDEGQCTVMSGDVGCSHMIV